MKLASLRDGTPEGRLVVVSRDVTLCSDARHVAPTLRAALDDWASVATALDLIAPGIESGGQPVQRFHEREAQSPLPGGADPRGAPSFALFEDLAGTVAVMRVVEPLGTAR